MEPTRGPAIYWRAVVTAVALGERVKISWSDPSTEPPPPQSGLWTLAKFAEANKIGVEQVMENLRLAGVSAGRSVRDVASGSGRRPMDVVQIVQGLAPREDGRR
jgi:hypothetical protein